MARLSRTINISELPERKSFEPIPKGKYTVQITDTDLRYSTAGNEYIWLELTVVRNQQFQGRKVFTRIMLSHSNPTALEINRRTLRALFDACGIDHIDDTGELMGKVVTASVTVRPADDKYDASNDVKDFDRLEQDAGGIPPQAAPAAPQAKIAPAPAMTGRPW